MTTNKPEVRVFRPSTQDGWPAMRRVFPSDPVGRDSKYVQLSDYEKLAAECEKLRSIISDLKGWDCDVRGGFLSIPVDLRRRMQEAIGAGVQGGQP